MAFQMTDSQQVDITITAVDKKGNPANVVPGSVEWLVDNPNVCSITPASGGTVATLAALGPIGTVVVTVNADVTGDATPDITGTLEVEIVPGAPTQITLVPGQPADIP